MADASSTNEDQNSENMRVDPARAKVLIENIASVAQRIDAVRGTRPVRLIAVSKLKPATDVLALHTSPSRAYHDFGENYAQELSEKAALLPRSIRWHMIGALQSNKCKGLAENVPNLWCVSSVDTVKKANELEKGRKALAEKDSGVEGKREEQRLRVLVQVNTSGEENKSGVEPDNAAELCRHIREKCPHLRLGGLMTIGAIARSREASGNPEAENEDFDKLKETRDVIVKELGLGGEEALELSMGMSADFEAAIKQGSDEVRVGTTIFGQRPPRNEAKIT